MWQVARDAFLRYIDSEQFGSGKFAEFMEETLAADEGGRGPRNLFRVRGATFRVWRRRPTSGTRSTSAPRCAAGS